MKPILPVIAVLAIVATSALATTYSWPDKKRPPVTIDQALAKASDHIGERAKTCYCVFAHLNGNEAGDGKEGVWNFTYKSEKGKSFIVCVDMSGKVNVNE